MPIRLRLTTALLIGWCGLVGLWLLTAPVRLLGCFAERSCQPNATVVFREPRVGIGWLLIGVIGALALAALRWWDGQRVRSMPTRRLKRMSIGMCVLVSVIAVGIGTQLLLFAPGQPHLRLATPVRLAGGRFYPLNADSPYFMHLAHNPGLVLKPHAPRQSRPGYAALAALSTRLFGPGARYLGLDRLFRERDSAYIPLILINVALLMTAAVLLVLLLRRLGAPPIVVVPALAFLLVINDLTKAFFWTPHLQMFALLVPMATIAISTWVLRTRPDWRALAALGFAVGLAALVYGSVVITVAVVTVLLLLHSRNQWRRVGVLWAAFALPQLAWVVVCEIFAGSYYNQETSVYHEFVWLPQAAVRGPHVLYQWVRADFLVSARAVLVTAGLPLLLLLGLVVAAILAGIRLAPATEDERRILVGTGVTLGISVLFFFAIGGGTPRISYYVLPPILLLIGWVTAKLIASPVVKWRFATLAIPVASIAFITQEIAKHGPYY